MKLNNLRTRRSPQLMIIPMIDIIFFLLVFFMMSTMYMVEQNVLPVALPQASSAQNDHVKRIPVTITADGLIQVNRETISYDNFHSRLQAELKADPSAVFVLRADQTVAYGQVIMVLDDMKKAGISRVSVATERAAE